MLEFHPQPVVNGPLPLMALRMIKQYIILVMTHLDSMFFALMVFISCFVLVKPSPDMAVSSNNLKDLLIEV